MKNNDDKSYIEQQAERIVQMDHSLGKGLLMPFNNNNSGQRKILAGIQTEHSLCLFHPEPANIQTGYENRYGDRSASIKENEGNVVIRAKIEKFESVPGHHYYLIVTDDEDMSISIIERVSYRHNTESYGYMINNDIIDSYRIGDTIPDGEIISKSSAFDQYQNDCMGVNLLVGYIAKDDSMEDAIIISETGAKKLASPLIKEVRCVINDNDIILNLMGDDEHIKSFADIGEEVRNGILLATRREKNEDCLFMQSKNKLREILMYDITFMVEGRVIDIDIHCNTPEKLYKKTNSQLLYYYENKIRYTRELVDIVDELKSMGYKEKGDLERIYFISKQELGNCQYIDKGKTFSGTEIRFIILEESVPNKGDKITNRYGGKGVISKVVPDNLMPAIEGSNKRLELILNSSTCTNRLNDGQLKEMELNFISSEILRFIATSGITVDEAYKEILDFIRMCSPNQALVLENLLDNWNMEQRKMYLYSMIEYDAIVLSMEPITESITTDKLGEIYDRFPYVDKRYLYVPIKGSAGRWRMIKSRRPVVCGKLYIYRLKQYAEDKFSVTSLSSTNIRNQNSRSKASKNFKSIHQNTPIRFGEMEHGDLTHISIELVKEMMMLYSSSPHGRLLMQKLYTDDPYNVDIKLDEKSIDRSAEIVNVRFKTMGLRLNFKKVPRNYKNPIERFPLYHESKPLPVFMHIFKDEKGYDFMKDFKKQLKNEESFNNLAMYHDPMYKMDPIKDNIEKYIEEMKKRTAELGLRYISKDKS